MTDVELKTELMNRGKQAIGSKEQMIEALTEKDHSMLDIFIFVITARVPTCLL